MKRALLVGINNYDQAPALSCCVDDAKGMAERLGRNEDGSLNYECHVLTSDETRITEADLRGKVRELFGDCAGGDLVFYFSGHGMMSDTGGYLVTQDGQLNDQGYPMSELLQVANRGNAGSVSLILDCCHSGGIGNDADNSYNQVTLSEGVTILAASGPRQVSREGLEYSLFTELVLDALEGGAADIRGEVSAAAIYAYVEQALGAWQQRPIYKSHARRLNPIRRCKPAVSDAELRKLTEVFPAPQLKINLDPTYEYTDPSADRKHVALFDMFKKYRNARLLKTSAEEDLYFAAMGGGSVELTPLGRFYWQQVADNLI
jgi:uncharacterized caspase-like protein